MEEKMKSIRGESKEPAVKRDQEMSSQAVEDAQLRNNILKIRIN